MVCLDALRSALECYFGCFVHKHTEEEFQCFRYELFQIPLLFDARNGLKHTYNDRGSLRHLAHFLVFLHDLLYSGLGDTFVREFRKLFNVITKRI